MDLLLDTCTFLWWVAGSDVIPASTLALLRDPEHRVLLSAASAWEITVKYALGRLPLAAPPDEYIPDARARHHIETLPIGESSWARGSALPQSAEVEAR